MAEVHNMEAVVETRLDMAEGDGGDKGEENVDRSTANDMEARSNMHNLAHKDNL